MKGLKGKDSDAGIEIDTPMAYTRIEFLETHVFTRQIIGLLSDDSYAELQRELIRNPKKGNLIVGGGGIRKLRWSLENNRGKSGGIRKYTSTKSCVTSFSCSLRIRRMSQMI